GHAAAEAHVAGAGSLLCALERGVDAVGDEVEHRATFHLERASRVVREHENRRVIRRLVAPPALPALVGPRPAHRPEHVAPEDPRADAAEALRGHLMVDARLAARLSLHLAPEPRVEEPFHQLGAIHAERLLQAL